MPQKEPSSGIAIIRLQNAKARNEVAVALCVAQDPYSIPAFSKQPSPRGRDWKI